MKINKDQLGYFKNNREFKNISFSLVFRLGAIICNFFIVPLLIKQLSTTEYGILATIISISTWFTFVDFGLANGLKNKISESLAKGEFTNVRKYITAGYSALFQVVAVLSVALVSLNFFIDWNQILKGPEALHNSINIIFFYGLLLFFARILAELINPILLAYHKTAAASFISFIAQFAILVIAYGYKKSGSHSFIHYGLLFFWIPVTIYTICNIYFYLTSLKHVKPLKDFYEKRFQKNLFKLGGSFFVIQIAYLIVFTTDNLIIGRIFGYIDVSNYNIAFRYFNIPLFIISIVLTPYWPIFAESYAKNEATRIKNIMTKLLFFWVAFIFVSVVMLLIAPFVYSLWVGPKIKVSFLLNLGMALSTIVSGWNSIFATFINSTSKLKLQTYSSVLTGIINIPVCIFLATKTNLGPAGVIFGTFLCLLVGALWAPIQYKKLINQRATGIWNK
ncbi:MAG: lipopolysaccharide biosynthesis protein [Segetibacter sp.]